MAMSMNNWLTVNWQENMWIFSALSCFCNLWIKKAHKVSESWIKHKINDDFSLIKYLKDQESLTNTGHRLRKCVLWGRRWSVLIRAGSDSGGWPRGSAELWPPFPGSPTNYHPAGAVSGGLMRTHDAHHVSHRNLIDLSTLSFWHSCVSALALCASVTFN